MSADTLMENRKASRLFFLLVEKPAGVSTLARRAGLQEAECEKLLGRMQRAGMVTRRKRSWAIDWDSFVPLFVRRAMNIYSLAMPWRFVPYYLERDEPDVVEAACARAERELAVIKVKLAANPVFFQLVRDYFDLLVQEAWAPEDYLDDLLIADAVDEFEIALLKLLPLMRRRGAKSPEHRELRRILGQWYRQLQGYDTPAGAALRAAFERQGLL